jgi:hypothetical protein
MDLTSIIATRQAMDKPNTNKTTPGGIPDINLENPFFSEVNLRDSGRDQQLFDKDSSSATL